MAARSGFFIPCLLTRVLAPKPASPDKRKSLPIPNTSLLVYRGG